MTNKIDDTNYDIDLFSEDSADYSVKVNKRRKNREAIKKEETVNSEKRMKKDSKKRKHSNSNIVLGVLLGVVLVVVVITIITSQVRLTELNQEISDAKHTLEEKQSIYTQYQMKVDANLSTAVVEKYAQENLGMTKATNSQKEFISLSQGDKAEVTIEEEKNIFTKIAEAFASLWA